MVAPRREKAIGFLDTPVMSTEGGVGSDGCAVSIALSCQGELAERWLIHIVSAG